MTPINTLAGVPRALGLAGILAGAVAFAGCSGAIEGMSGKDPAGKPGGGSMSPMGGGSTPGGSMGGSSNGGSSNGGGGTTSGPQVISDPGPMGPSAAPSPLRRLTAQQYVNTVRDLLRMPDAGTVVTIGALPADGSVAERFATNTQASVQGLDADKYADAADALARKAVTNLAGLVPCDPKAGNADCASQFITNFGRRAFRRPLSSAEIDRYKRAFVAGSTGADFTNGIRVVIQAFLQSPKFLYLVEPVPENSAGKLLRVDSWAMASRLSYFLLGSMPDDALFAAAEKDELSTPDQISAQADRLIADNRFKDTVRSFHAAWLELNEVAGADKDPKLFPTWNDELKAALGEQTYRFVEAVFSEGGSKAAELLTGTTSYLKGPLYDLYGVAKPAGAAANEWAKVTLDGKQRGGLLTQAGFMAGLAHEDRTSFILRGKIVREALLCAPVPPPPPGLNASETNIPATATAKERSEMHRVSPECASCHALFDPIGFAFETYDAIGKYRTTDAAGKPIDSVLDMKEGGALDGHYNDALELMKKLADSDVFAACLAKQWMRFGLGREVDDGDKGADRPSILAAQDALKKGGKISDLLTALAKSDAFRHQKVLP